MKSFLCLLIVFISLPTFANQTVQTLIAEKTSLESENSQASARKRELIAEYNIVVERVNAASESVNAVIQELNNLRDKLTRREITRDIYDQKHAEYETSKAAYDLVHSELQVIMQEMRSIDEKIALNDERISDIEDDVSLAQTTQLKSREMTREAEFSLNQNSTVSASSLEVDRALCEELKEFNASAPKYDEPGFEESRAKRKELRNLCLVSSKINQDTADIEGFTLLNNINSPINTTGNGEFQGPSREFDFSFLGRSIQTMNLMILDNARTSGRLSHDEMFKLMIFIPRRVYPYIETDYSKEPKSQTVYLPTGEPVEFNALTKEILSGVLIERAIDTSSNRHSRRFPDVEYTGKGITIEAVRRGGYPAYIHAQSFNQFENTTHAIVKYQDKECLVPKEKLWIGAETQNSVTFKFHNDEDFITEIANEFCGWEVKLEELF